MILISLIVACLALCAQAFLPACGSRWLIQRMDINTRARHVGGRSTSILLEAKPDLFSDDLFEEDDSPDEDTKQPVQDEKNAKKVYLDEKWQLSKEDEADYKRISTKDGSKNDGHPPPGTKFPAFALMYKLRREYAETSIESALSEHEQLCKTFKRLLNSEVIRMGGTRGAVLLWIGLSADDKDETKADITSFMEKDPLITMDMIERWDIIDLSADPNMKLPPLGSPRVPPSKGMALPEAKEP